MYPSSICGYIIAETLSLGEKMVKGKRRKVSSFVGEPYKSSTSEWIQNVILECGHRARLSAGYSPNHRRARAKFTVGYCMECLAKEVER